MSFVVFINSDVNNAFIDVFCSFCDDSEIGLEVLEETE
jgi:hypothetical protein